MTQTKTNHTKNITSLAFNKRYLTIGILIYILGAYTAICCDFTPNNLKILFAYTCIFVLLIVLTSICLSLVFRKDRQTKSLIFPVSISALIFITAFTFSSSKIYSFDQQRETLLSHPRIIGSVKGSAEYSTSGVSMALTIDVHTASNDEASVNFEKPCLIKLYVPRNTFSSISHGDTIKCSIIADDTSSPAFDGAFDYTQSLRQNKIVCSAYSYNAEKSTTLSPKNPIFFKFEELGLRLRNEVIKSTEVSAYGSDELQLLQGILLGKTDAFSDTLYSNLKKSGFIHIASVSGMHTSYLFIAITLLLGLMRLPKRFICFAAIPLMAIFTSIAQFSPPVCRAVIVMIIFLLASIIRRESDSITSLSIAGLILVINNPYTLQNYSALMSFGATLGILIYYPIISKRLRFAIMKPPKKIVGHSLRYLAINSLYNLNKFSVNSICLSFCATLGLAYFMMKLYGTLQWGSIFGNIPLAPLVAISFIFGYANCIINLALPFMAEVIAKFVISPSLFAIIRLADFFSADIFNFRTPSPPSSFFIVYITICVFFYFWIKPSKK